MLEHQKIVLNAVAGDLHLFKREIKKSAEWLNLEEQKELKDWVMANLNANHNKIVHEVFIPNSI